jgi:hypothetical protein
MNFLLKFQVILNFVLKKTRDLSVSLRKNHTASSHKIEVGSFVHATRLVSQGTSHAANGLFLSKCNKLKSNISDFHLVQIRPKKIAGLGRCSCMVTKDGATCFTSREIIPILREKFLDRLILLRVQSYSLRSCDLTLCDFFLKDTLKSRVYQNKVRNDLELKQEIHPVLNELDETKCYPVMVNYMERIITWRTSREGHMPDIVFQC